MLFLYLFALIGSSSAIFSFEDCKKPDSLVTFTSYSLADPVPNGDRYKLSFSGVVKSPIAAGAVINVALKKMKYGSFSSFGNCFDDFGTCSGIKACGRPGFPSLNPFFYFCADDDTIPVGPFSIATPAFFPKLDGFEEPIVDGDYKGNVTLVDVNKKEIGCYTISFTVLVPKK